jgi:hypothetical protein
MVEIDQWIVDFAHLFRDSTGLDFDRHVELHNLGFDKIQVRTLRALPCEVSRRHMRPMRCRS